MLSMKSFNMKENDEIPLPEMVATDIMWHPCAGDDAVSGASIMPNNPQRIILTFIYSINKEKSNYILSEVSEHFSSSYKARNPDLKV